MLKRERQRYRYVVALAYFGFADALSDELAEATKAETTAAVHVPPIAEAAASS